jgi:hypothetical protein
MRAVGVMVVLAACGARGPATKLPEAPPASLDAVTPMMAPEHTTWNVFLGSLQIGRAELVVDRRAARSEFHTNALARVIEPVSYELVSRVDRSTARETVTISGKTARHDLGARHTLHSALGVVRAWSLRAPRAGYLWLAHQGEQLRLDVFPPERDDLAGVRALLIPGVVRSRDGAISLEIELWLAANADRTPLKFAVGSGTSRVTAEVSASTGSFEAR